MGKFNLIPCRVLLLQFFIIFPCAFSLHVVFGSNCTALCSYQNPLSNTTSVDVTCSDKNYEKTSVGRTFKDCVTCEFESISFDHGTRQTDLGWGLYNLRYTLNWCLWGATIDASVASCDEACQPIKESLNVKLENSTSPTPYGYCEDLDREGFANCAACYAKVSDRKYLSNFLNLLISACEWQILPPKKFPIKGSQVFTQNPPSNYSSPSASSGLSTEAKLAIGISIPIIIFLFLCALLLLWYFKFRLPRKPPSQVSEPEFQLWERQGEKWNQAPDLTPSSTWKSDPSVYHSTPPPQQSRHHPPFRLQLPPPRRQGTTRPKMQLETETIADQYAGTYSPSELFGDSPTSPRTALRQEHGQKGKGKSQVSFNIRGRPARPEKGVGRKEAVVSEDLF